MAILKSASGNVHVKSSPIAGGYNSTQSAVAQSWGWAGPTVPLLGNETPRTYGQLYREQPYLKAAVDRIAEGMAILPLKTYDRAASGEKKRLIDHPLPNLIASPHPSMSPFRFKEVMAWDLALNGNSLAVMVENPEIPNAPMELWPVPWPFVRVQGRAEPEVYHVILPVGRFSFPPNRVFHLRFGPSDPYFPLIGLSPVETLRRTLVNEDGAARWTTAVFKNSGRPSGILSTEQKLNDSQLAAVRDQAQTIYGGPDNAFRIAVMQGGLSWQPVAFNAVESGLMQVRQWDREEVASVYNVPPSMLGDLTRATFSNVTENRRMFYTGTLPPWLTLFEEEFYSQIVSQVPGWDKLYVEFDTNEVLKSSPKERAETYAISRRYMTVNEIRDRENLPRIPHPEYDLVWEPINEVPIGAAHQPTPPNPNPDGIGQEPAAPKSILAKALDRAERIGKSKLGGHNGHVFSAERFARELTEDFVVVDEELKGWAELVADSVADVLANVTSVEDLTKRIELLRENLDLEMTVTP